MGFLEEIERKKQEEIQWELTRQAEEERQRQIAAQKLIEERTKEQQRHERNARGFIKDISDITNLLGLLYESGYKGYFEDVSKVSGFKLQRGFFTEFSHPDFYFCSDWNMTHEDLLTKGSELSKQQVLLEEKMKDSLSKLGWQDLWNWPIPDKVVVMPPHTIFFDDDVAHGKISETQGVGIGIRFSKEAKTKEHSHRLAEIFNIEHYYLFEQWTNAVYVRINAHHGTTITGSNQRRLDLADLRNLKLFDEALYQAMQNPAVLYSRAHRKWEPPSPPSEEHPGDCLPNDSIISAPSGSIPIKNLKKGDLVWTMDRSGHRAQAVITKKTKKECSKNHKMVHFVLQDGRELFVSPGHPTINNEPIGSLKGGQILNRSKIISVSITPYQGKYTYDILPSGDTGRYWANNILIGSTLCRDRDEEAGESFFL